MALIEVQQLAYRYEGGRQVLRDISFSLEQGSITAVIGLSGCGKTTLCYALCGIVPQVLGGELSGRILLAGEDIAAYPLSQLASRIALVLQNPDEALFTTTVEDELAFAPENLCLPPQEISRRVGEALDLLNIARLRLRDPGQLSGGQKKLVALAAMLTLRPEVLVLDEPLGQLDSRGRELVWQALLRLQAAGHTLIIVEHDLQAAAFADRWLLLGEDGRLLCNALPEKILAEREFLGSQHLI